MRLGNFAVSGPDGRKVEITVVTFPGQAGGELENVNRWRRQIGLPPIGADEIKSENVMIGGNAAKVYDLTGAEPAAAGEAKKRTVAAIALVNGDSWFFKMSGDAELAAAQRPAFDEFLKSVTFGAGAASTPSPAPAAPAESAAGQALTVAPANEGRPGAPHWEPARRNGSRRRVGNRPSLRCGSGALPCPTAQARRMFRSRPFRGTSGGRWPT
jgi:hypothetical protein